MYSKFTLTIALMFALAISNAQIPNSSFENWDNMGTYSNPTSWGTMNNTTTVGGIYTATKGTPGNPGTAYLKLTSKTTPLGVANGIAVSGKLDSMTQQAKSGFAYSNRPTSLNGAWQHMIFGNSQGSITVTLTKWNTATSTRDVIGTATKTLSGMAMSWANFSIPFSYVSANTPDTCIIVMKASGSAPADGDYLWVDNLTFSEPVGINDLTNHHFSIFPNPLHADQNLQVNIENAGNVKAEIYSMDGKRMATLFDTFLEEGAHSFHLEATEKLTVGVYFLQISEAELTQTIKLIID